jgi:hypothetical protein
MSIPQATDWLLEHADDPEPPSAESGGDQREGGGEGEGGAERGLAGSGSAVVGGGGSVPMPALPLFQGNRASVCLREREGGGGEVNKMNRQNKDYLKWAFHQKMSRARCVPRATTTKLRVPY